MVGIAMDLPNKLYKYRSLATQDRQNTLSIFAHNQLWYAKASSLNDPFDCNFDILSGRSNEEWEQAFQTGYESLRDGFRALGTWVRSAVAQSRARSADKAEVLSAAIDAPAETPQPEGPSKLSFNVSVEGVPKTLEEALNPIMAKRAAALKKELDERVGVLSLTEIPDDILMWSHYTNGHNGICLEFDVESYGGAFPHLGPVGYQDEYPEVTYKFVELLKQFGLREEAHFNLLLKLALSSREVTEEADAQVLHTLDLMRHWFFTKSAHWSYEKEWRGLSSRPGLHAFPAAALSGVVVGCVNTASNLALVRECVQTRRRKVKLYVAEKEPRAFRLRVSAAE